MRIGSLILAAGASQRFGAENKLTHIYRNRPLILNSLYCWLGAAHEFYASCLILGYQADRIKEILKMQPELQGAELDIVINPKYREGLSSSLSLGVAKLAAKSQLQGLMVLLADMPEVAKEDLLLLLNRFNKEKGGKVVCYSHRGQFCGPPLVMPFPNSKHTDKLSGDRGFKAILTNLPMVLLENPRRVVHRDIDRKADLR